MKALTGRLLGYVVAGAIAAALIFWTFGKITALYDLHDRLTTEASKAALVAHPALVRLRAKMLVLQQRAQAASASEHATADSLRRLLSTGQRTDTVTLLREIAVHDSTAVRRCEAAVLACEARAASAIAEADTLSRRLTAQLKVRDYPWGVTVGFGAAAGHGVAWGATIAVTRRILRIPLLH